MMRCKLIGFYPTDGIQNISKGLTRDPEMPQIVGSYGGYTGMVCANARSMPRGSASYSGQ